MPSALPGAGTNTHSSPSATKIARLTFPTRNGPDRMLCAPIRSAGQSHRQVRVKVPALFHTTQAPSVQQTDINIVWIELEPLVFSRP